MPNISVKLLREEDKKAEPETEEAALKRAMADLHKVFDAVELSRRKLCRVSIFNFH